MAIIKNPLTIVQSGGGSVELGTYNKIGQPFVVGSLCKEIKINTNLTAEKVLQLCSALPITAEIDGLPCYVAAEFDEYGQLIFAYMEGAAAVILGNTDNILIYVMDGQILFPLGQSFVLGATGRNVLEIGSSNSQITEMVSNGEFTKGDVFTQTDEISGKYETKSLYYPNDVVDKQINTINKEDKTILTEITNLPVFIGGINYALATAQIEYYGMCQIKVTGADPYEEAVVFRQTQFGGSGIVPLQGGKSLRLTKVRVLSATFAVTFTFYYDKVSGSLAPETERVVVPGSTQPQEVQIPVYEGARCYRIDASETD